MAVAMNGLNSEIKTFVITKEPKNMEELRRFAVLAEKAVSSKVTEMTNSFENVLTEIKSLKTDLKKCQYHPRDKI